MTARRLSPVNPLVLLFLSAMLLVAFAGLHPVYGSTQSQLTVASRNTSGTTITGYYTVLYQNGAQLASAFTPATFPLNNGQSYAVLVEDYGSCHFDHWADTGSTNAYRTISITTDTQIIAVYNCGGGGGGGGSSVSVSSVDQNNKAITGYYTVLFNSAGSVVTTGFTPKTFSTTSGSTYSVSVSNYGNCNFNHWSDGATSNPRSFTASASSTSFTAVYNCGGGGGGGGSGTITIFDHRVSSPYWAPCFASVCSAGTGPGTGMWVVLYDSAGNIVATGFADENGLTFSGLNQGSTYLIYPADCSHCHGSNHDVLFDHWGDGTNTRPRSVTPGTSVDAWYVCTNTCS